LIGKIILFKEKLQLSAQSMHLEEGEKRVILKKRVYSFVFCWEGGEISRTRRHQKDRERERE
jgi:hypothetical protein